MYLKPCTELSEFPEEEKLSFMIFGVAAEESNDGILLLPFIKSSKEDEEGESDDMGKEDEDEEEE